MKGALLEKLDGTGLRVGIVTAGFNRAYTESLTTWCVKALIDSGLVAENITQILVPGSYEIPWGCQKLALTGNFDVVVAVGVLIKGDTVHFEYIAEAVSRGIMEVGLKTGVPIIFGVLTCLNEEQAQARCNDDQSNKGYEFGLAAVRMGLLQRN